MENDRLFGGRPAPAACIASLAALAVLSGCRATTPDYDACGQVDAVEVTVSAEGSGRITSLGISEGDRLSEGSCVGCIDTVQLYLQREELLRRKRSAEVKLVDIACQMQAQYAQLENLRTELGRASALLEKDAGTQKQVDDLTSQVAVLEAQIAAAEQNYRQNNASVECRADSPDYGQDSQMPYMRAHRRYRAYEVCRARRVCQFWQGPLRDGRYGRPLCQGLAGLQVGDRVRVFPDDGSDRLTEYEGTVSWIASEAEFTPKNIQTRDERADMVYAVKVALPAGTPLRLGMYAYVLAH